MNAKLDTKGIYPRRFNNETLLQGDASVKTSRRAVAASSRKKGK